MATTERRGRWDYPCRVPHFWVADLRRHSYLLYSRPEGEDYSEQQIVHDRAALRLPPELA